uniref:RING-type domain-containing protein n=1 Tax=Poecilia formosa TaxID=48698 RepID=A0A087YEE4_POEFO
MEDTDQTRWEELLRCTVCHDTFKDPRQLPCGHSMCMDCLTKLLDHSTDSPFRCPDCRADFGQVVELQKSYALASIAEDFRLIKKRRETLAECVYCDCCPETKTAAFKSCLKCEVSLCREHMKDHLELQAFTGHPLVDPLSDLLERKCPQHRDQVLRYYCCSSRRYVCNMCALESKQLGSASDASAVLRRQLTDYMDQYFKTLQQQMNESINAVRTQHEKLKGNPLDRLNGVTVVLLSLWFIVLYYAYHYSVENQTLADALERQQSRVHHIYSSIAGHMADHPLKRLSEDEGMVVSL